MSKVDSKFFRRRLEAISVPPKPRRISGLTAWSESPQNADKVDKELKRLAAKGTFPIRSQIIQDFWRNIPAGEQASWRIKAEKATQSAAKVPTPEEIRARLLANTGHVWSEFLEIWTELSGWPAVLITGGPGLSESEQPRMISVHSTFRDDPQLKWHKTNPEQWKNVICPAFGEFLGTCFAPGQEMSEILDENLPCKSEDQEAQLSLVPDPDTCLSMKVEMSRCSRLADTLPLNETSADLSNVTHGVALGPRIDSNATQYPQDHVTFSNLIAADFPPLCTDQDVVAAKLLFEPPPPSFNSTGLSSLFVDAPMNATTSSVATNDASQDPVSTSSNDSLSHSQTPQLVSSRKIPFTNMSFVYDIPPEEDVTDITSFTDEPPSNIHLDVGPEPSVSATPAMSFDLPETGLIKLSATPPPRSCIPEIDIQFRNENIFDATVGLSQHNVTQPQPTFSSLTGGGGVSKKKRAADLELHGAAKKQRVQSKVIPRIPNSVAQPSVTGRHLRTSTSTLSVTIPPGISEKLQPIAVMLLRSRSELSFGDEGRTFAELLAAWFIFVEKHKQREIQTSAWKELCHVKLRPAVLTTWMRAKARSQTWRPLVNRTAISQMEEEFLAWWKALMDSLSSRIGMKTFWDPLRDCGPCGVVLAVVGLFFWGDGIKTFDPKSTGKRWKSAAAEVTKVLTKMNEL
ncbi:hypothetical protein C8J56DRAFT_486441 [Mycena floridula]|nr:hypothetical protein C8J56DRAFT_486441 [Mycena floridula]